MRLSDFELATTATLHVRDIMGRPAFNSDGSPVTIELRSDDDEVVKAQERLATNRRLKNLQRIRMTAEEIEAEGLDKLAAATVAWHTFEDSDGETIVCNRANARALYAAHAFIREQVDTFIADRANFLPKSATG